MLNLSIGIIVVSFIFKLHNLLQNITNLQELRPAFFRTHVAIALLIVIRSTGSAAGYSLWPLCFVACELTRGFLDLAHIQALGLQAFSPHTPLLKEIRAAALCTANSMVCSFILFWLFTPEKIGYSFVGLLVHNEIAVEYSIWQIVSILLTSLCFGFFLANFLAAALAKGNITHNPNRWHTLYNEADKEKSNDRKQDSDSV
jgi:hypothetical protein